MANRGPIKRRVGGAVATTHDGRVWTWTIGSWRFRWCLLGHVEVVLSQRICRLGHYRRIDAAMAHTVGWIRGLGDVTQDEVASREIG